ncbi:MAG: PKD domain-containing protein [Novosphingobium sp.]
MSIDRRTFAKATAAGSAGLLASLATGQGTMSTTNQLYPDKLFTEPFIDQDEWRDQPVRHRYVHGGFTGSDLKFSMYFPPKEQYQRRFFHPLMHIAGNENVALAGALGGIVNSLQFAFASGAYLVESNMGATTMTGPVDITNFRASAATAQYGRIVAAKMYGEHRPYGYVYGGSGGAFKTIACVENTHRVWDGSVPFIHGSPVALPNVFTVQAHALRILDGKFEQILDAIEPGGSGDMYAGLSDEQQAALREVTQMGMPPRAWFAHKSLGIAYTGVFASIILPLFQTDPGYFKDFWTKPGYLGFDAPQSLAAARIQQKTAISAIVTTDEVRKMGLPVSIAAGTRPTAPAAIRVAELPAGRLQGAFLVPQGGAANNQRLMITANIGDLILLGFGGEAIPVLEAMKVGDPILIDNSDYLATQTFHRHQNPPPEYYVWQQFRGTDGKPIYPQHPLYESNQAGSGNSFMQGRFDGKMIVVDCLMDEAAYPWQADWYRGRVKSVLGARFEEQYRLWYVDHAMHVGPARYVDPAEGHAVTDDASPAHTQVVNYSGILQRALRDLAAWVETGVAPVRESAYRIEDGQVHIPASAAERHGVQPVVALTMGGKLRADVTAGQSVEFVGVIETPPDAGVVVAAEWDFDGSGKFAQRAAFSDGQTRQTVRNSHVFAAPGTYFVTLRGGSQRQEAVGTPYGKALNLARVRVVVT